MTVDIQVDHAIVHTVTVDVKILRVSKRQVTLSVFKQLDEKRILNQDGSLRGVPWGKVRYKWDETPKWADYYVVWQEGRYLLRTPLPLIANLSASYQDKMLCEDGKYYYSMEEVCYGFTLWLYGTHVNHTCLTDSGPDGICSGELFQSREEDHLTLIERMHEFEKLDQLFIAT